MNSNMRAEDPQTNFKTNVHAVNTDHYERASRYGELWLSFPVLYILVVCPYSTLTVGEKVELPFGV